MKMACNIITSNCRSLDTLTLILFKPLGNKCFKSRTFGTLELAGAVRSLRKGKGKVSSTQKELNNQFKISFYVDRQPLIPTFFFNACPIRGYFFFFLSAFPHQMDFCYCRSAEGVRSFRVHQAGTSFLATPPSSPFSRSLPPSDNSLPLSPPPST